MTIGTLMDDVVMIPAMADDDLPPGADELYGLPLEDFVAERAALSKRLRGEGDRDGAKRVAALRKPSVAAWTVNQLVRSRGRDVAEFTDAAAALRDAQQALLEGHGSADGLREARAAERDAVQRLAETARGLFPGGREPGEATLERVASTLHAAAADEGIRGDVLSGRLLAEREFSGFGDLGAAPAAAPPARRTRKSRRPARVTTEDDEGQRARAEAEARARAEAEAAERERRERRAVLQAALDEAVAERERAQEALEEARAEEGRRRQALDDAQ